MTVTSSRYTYEGTETTETSITRTGGFADPTGGSQSRKIVTTANSQWLRPFRAEPYVAWNGVTDTTVTATVYGVVNGGVLPNNDELWMDVEHLKASSGVLGTIVTTTKANLLAGSAAVTSDSSTWNNTAYATFDGVNSSQVTVSVDGLTATLNTATNNTGARSAVFLSTGKYYFEFRCNAIHGAGVGILTAVGTYANLLSVATTHNTVASSGGSIVSNGITTGYTLGTIVANDVIGVAVDLTNHKGWFRRNGGLWNGNASASPVTGVNGVTIVTDSLSPALAFGGGAQQIGDSWTANFGLTSYANAAPSGYGNWPGVWSPFKLTKTLDLNATAPIAGDPTPVTWDAATVANVTLSGGNLVATNTGTTSADQGARVASASGFTTGKYYFEATFTTVTGAANDQANFGVGIATTASTYTGMGTNGTTGVELFRVTSVWAGGSTAVSVFTASPGINTRMDTGDIAGIAIDLDNRKAWFRTDVSGAWNNNASANPVTNVGGVTIPAGIMVPIVTFGGTLGTAGQVLTANFGASSFTGVVPSGFTSGWPTSLAIPSYSAPVGYIEARVRAAKASTTYYIDPTIELSPSGATAGAVTAYKTSRYAYEGTETTETSITRVNGAADPTGQQQSRKIVTTANSQWLRPFKAEPYAQWSNVTGADVSVTVCGTVNSGSLPLNDEIWMDVEYLGEVPDAFTPASLTGLIGWWDASVTASLTLSGSNVDAVADQSGSGNNLGWAFAKPVYNAAGFNSKPAFMTNGTGAGNAFTNASFPLGTGNTLTCWYVGNISSVSSNTSCGIISYVGAGQSTDWQSVNSFVLYRPSSATTLIGFTRLTDMQRTCTTDANHRVIVTINSSGVMTFYIDGGIQATATAAGNWTSPGELNICRSKAAAYTGGAFGEFGIATGYSDAATVRRLDVYLQNKWMPPVGSLGKIVTTTKSNVLATGTSVTSDSSSWSGGGSGAGWSPFKLTTTLSSPQPGVAGYIHVRPRVAKASSIYYLDPQINLS